MKTKLCIILLVSVIIENAAAQQYIKFQNINWGLPEQIVIDEMEQKGFEYREGNTEYVIFSGDIAAGPAQIILHFYRDQFYSADVLLDIHPTIEEMVFIFSERYGEPIKYEDEIALIYIWDLGDRGKFELSRAKLLPSDTRIGLTYLDTKIYMQKLRDELSGL